MNEKNSFEEFKRFAELLAECDNPYGNYFMKFVKSWEKDRELIETENDDG